MELVLVMLGKLFYVTANNLSEDGMLVIVLTISKTEKKMISDPDTISRGFVYAKDSEELLRNVNPLVKTTVNELQEDNIHQWNVIKKVLKKAVGQYLFTQTKKNPMILPIIIEI